MFSYCRKIKKAKKNKINKQLKTQTKKHQRVSRETASKQDFLFFIYLLATNYLKKKLLPKNSLKAFAPIFFLHAL